MVMMSLKLCNSNCFVSRCTQKIDPLFEDSEDMQNIFTKGHMKSSLDGRPSTFSDSSFGTVCLFLFVDCSSWPNLTTACAAQVAKRGVLSSFRHEYTFWCGSNRGLVTILVHLYPYRILYTSQLLQNDKIPASFLCQYSMTNDMACAEVSYSLFEFVQCQLEAEEAKKRHLDLEAKAEKLEALH